MTSCHLFWIKIKEDKPPVPYEPVFIWYYDEVECEWAQGIGYVYYDSELNMIWHSMDHCTEVQVKYYCPIPDLGKPL